MTELRRRRQGEGRARRQRRRRRGRASTLFYPAVVYPVQEGMKLYREEQFGPIVPVMPFDDIETALDYVITSDHGQQVSIFGSDPDQIGRLVDPLVNQVCRVNINCQCQRGPDVFPFTGRKDSAEGTLSVTDALRSFSIRSMIAAKQTEASKQLLDAIVQRPQVEVHQHGLHLLTAPTAGGRQTKCAANTSQDRRHAGPGQLDAATVNALFLRRRRCIPPQLQPRHAMPITGRASSDPRPRARAGRPIAILMDLQGPKLRVGPFAKVR